MDSLSFRSKPAAGNHISHCGYFDAVCFHLPLKSFLWMTWLPIIPAHTSYTTPIPLLLLCALLCQYCVPSVHSLSGKSQRTNPAKYTINEMLMRFRCLIPHCIYKCVSCQPSSSSAKLPLPANVSLTPVCSLIIPITTMRVEITCVFEIRSKYE